MRWRPSSAAMLCGASPTDVGCNFDARVDPHADDAARGILRRRCTAPARSSSPTRPGAGRDPSHVSLPFAPGTVARRTSTRPRSWTFHTSSAAGLGLGENAQRGSLARLRPGRRAPLRRPPPHTFHKEYKAMLNDTPSPQRKPTDAVRGQARADHRRRNRIGAAVATRMIQEGAVVTVMGRRKAPRTSWSVTSATPYHCRLNIKSSGPLDILVHNAGVAGSGWDHGIAVSLTAAHHLCEFAEPGPHLEAGLHRHGRSTAAMESVRLMTSSGLRRRGWSRPPPTRSPWVRLGQLPAWCAGGPGLRMGAHPDGRGGHAQDQRGRP